MHINEIDLKNLNMIQPIPDILNWAADNGLHDLTSNLFISYLSSDFYEPTALAEDTRQYIRTINWATFDSGDMELNERASTFLLNMQRQSAPTQRHAPVPCQNLNQFRKE